MAKIVENIGAGHVATPLTEADMLGGAGIVGTALFDRVQGLLQLVWGVSAGTYRAPRVLVEP